MMRIFESLLEESNKKKFIKNWLGSDTEKIEEYDKTYEEYRQVFDNEVKKRGLNWQTSMNLGIFEEILSDVKDRKSKSELKKQHKSSGKSAFLSYVLTNPDCGLTYLGTAYKWDYFRIETKPGVILAGSHKASLHGNTSGGWCICAKNSDTFEKELRAGDGYVLVIKSDDSNKNKEGKYCMSTDGEDDSILDMWTSANKPIFDFEEIYKILYGKEAEISEKRISGFLKGIDIGEKVIRQPEDRVLDFNEDQVIYNLKELGEQTNLYKSGTDQLINGKDVTTLEFIDLERFHFTNFFQPHNFYQEVELTNVEKIILPEGLKVIKSNYFKELKNLKHIEIPDSVEIIGTSAFSGCRSLESIKLPANLRKIGGYAFAWCESLKHLEIPDSIEEIGNNAFHDTAISDQSLIDKIESINKKAFKER